LNDFPLERPGEVLKKCGYHLFSIPLFHPTFIPQNTNFTKTIPGRQKKTGNKTEENRKQTACSEPVEL